MSCLRVLILLVLICASVGLATADEPAGIGITRIPLPERVPDEIFWYGVYQGRDKVGWAVQSLTLVGEGDAAVYLSRTTIEARLSGFGTSMDFAFHVADEFRGQPPYELLRSREVKRDGGGTRFLSLDREGSAYVARILSGTEYTTQRIEGVDYTLADRLTHIYWAQRDLEVGDRIRIREFDITELESDVYTYTVESIVERPAFGIEVRLFDAAMRSERKGPVGSVLLGTRGRVVRSPLAGVAEMRLESEHQAVETRLASGLFEFGQAPATEALGDPALIKRLVVAVYGRRADVFPDGARQTVHRDEESGDVILVSGEGVGESKTVGDKERVACLWTTKTYPAKDPRVLEIARGAVEGCVTAREKSDALVVFVRDFLGDVHVPEPVSVAWLLDEPMGDATDHARLFVTLARAVGLPARTVTGLVYLGDESTAFGWHTWCEVAIDGSWHQVDPTWGQTTVDATHLFLGCDVEDPVPLLAISDHLSIEIRDVVR